MRTNAATGEVRIIGGQWRSRRLRFPATAGLRPTPDRVRETLFNWLQEAVTGARCLDLFAGSGALGIEALSRGAKHATLIEMNATLCRYLTEQMATLGTQAADVIHSDALTFLNRGGPPYDIVFLDPPYQAADLLERSCAVLEQRDWLAPRALIYLETPGLALPTLPVTWKTLRSKGAGQVGYHLVQRTVSAPASA